MWRQPPTQTLRASGVSAPAPALMRTQGERRVWKSDNITLPYLHHLFGSLFYYSYIQTDDPGNFNMSGIYQVARLALNAHFS